MSKLRFFMSTSLDGFVAGPDQSAEDPLGVGALQLHEPSRLARRPWGRGRRGQRQHARLGEAHREYRGPGKIAIGIDPGASRYYRCDSNRLA
jgi:hypothetical protein